MAHVLELETKLVTSEITYAVHAMRAALPRSDHAYLLRVPSKCAASRT